jgi:hypothetical protein
LESVEREVFQVSGHDGLLSIHPLAFGLREKKEQGWRGKSNEEVKGLISSVQAYEMVSFFLAKLYLSDCTLACLGFV